VGEVPWSYANVLATEYPNKPGCLGIRESCTQRWLWVTVYNIDSRDTRRQFMLMRDVVESLEGNLQIIACDHANLENDWFHDSLVDNWRGGKALIPEDWLGTEAE
jgi:hypothetical protein